MQALRFAAKNLTTLLLAVALAIAVWVSAVSENDPNERRIYPSPVTIDIIGQDPSLIITSEVPRQVTLTLNAPRSVWTRLVSERGLVSAVANLSGLGPGEHNVPIQVNVNLRAVQVEGKSPPSINVTLQQLATRTLPVALVVRGEPATGYQAGSVTLDPQNVTISGPEPLVARVSEVRATLDLSQVRDNVRQTLTLQPLDANSASINGVTLIPDKVTASVPVTQRGGFRNVVVKVVTTGQIVSGYRLTTISVFPPAVTVFSTDPNAVDALPGYVETTPINLDGVRDDIDTQVALNLPEGIDIVGDQTVNVQVGIAAIEGSITLSNMRVETVGMGAGLAAQTSPDRVDVILSGPLYLLDMLTPGMVRVQIDVTNMGAGTYQVVPTVQISQTDIRVESILPGTLEVTVFKATATPTPTRTPTPTPTPRVR